MANIYTYTETVWTYHNTTRVSDESFEFNGIGAYAETTILGEDLGGLDNDLFLRGNITPSQGKLTQGLCCRLDFYAKQKTGQDYWDIENHLIYLKGDKNGQINQKLSLIGFQGYFDHMVLRIEVMPDAELALDGTIELTDFVIDDVSLNVDLSPVMDAIEEQGEAAKLMNDLLGLMMGVYPSRVMQEDGSFIYYWHDQPLMAESTTIWRLDANVFAVSNDGGQTWTGQTSDGTVIAKMVYALQIQASQVILSDGSDIDETLGELSGHFGETGDFTILESGYAAFVKRVTGSDPPVTGDYSTTTIDGGKIKANTVTANQINVVALDGSGELDSTGGKLKVTQYGVGTVEISPSNPLRVTDSYGNFIGGIVNVSGKVAVITTAIANNANLVGGYATIGQISGNEGRGILFTDGNYSFAFREGIWGTRDGGLAVYVDDRRRMEMLGNGAFAIYAQDSLIFNPGNPVSSSHFYISPNGQIIFKTGSSVNTMSTRFRIDPDSDVFLQSPDGNSHRVGVDSSGSYFIYNQSKTYFHNMSSGGYGDPITMTSAQDLDNYLTTGVWYTAGYTMTNRPTSYSNYAIFRVTAPAGGYAIQEYLCATGAQFRVRTAGSWGSWKAFA